MTRVRVLCVVLLLVGGAIAQRWVTPPVADTTPFRFTRFDGEYFPGTGKVYFLGGRKADLSTDSTIWSYDPSTHTYANTGQVLPRAISNYDICLVRDNYNLSAGDTFGLYVIGGRLAATGLGTDTIQVYYPRSNTVRKLTTDCYPGLVNGYVPSAIGAVVAGNKIYAQGGFTTQDYTPSNLSHVFDPLAAAGSRWTQLPNMNSARAYVAGATIDDTLVYGIGGDTVYPSVLVAVPRVERLNTRSLAAGWVRVHDMEMGCGETRAYAFQRADSLLGFSRQIVVAGTGQWPYESAYCRVYAVAGDSWHRIAPLDSARRNHAGAYIPGTGSGTYGVPGIWIWGGRKTSDAWLLPTPEYYALGVNAGCVRLIAPAGGVDSGSTVTPACSTYNFGVGYATYKVRLKIGSYTDSATVTNQAPNAKSYVTFPNWIANVPRGSYSVSCSTMAVNDLNASNDKQTGSITVNVRDVGMRAIVAPGGTMDSVATLVPACSVYNYGNTTEDYTVRMKIGTGYDSTASVTAHAPGTVQYVTFPAWNVGPRGVYAVVCSTQLATDMHRGNDRMYGQVTIRAPQDVSPTAIVAPAGVVPLNQVVTPQLKVKNLGSASATFPVMLMINGGGGTVYADTETVTGLAGGAEATVSFSKTWPATPVGSYTTVAWTMLSGDANPANDTIRNSFLVQEGGGGGPWTLKTPMPSGAKPCKDGAWLTYDAGTVRVYASRGNKQLDFFSYNVPKDSWKALAPWLPGSEGKPPSKSSAGCADGAGRVYAVKGNGTPGFHMYDAGANVWTQKKDVPLGLSNKKLKGGSGIAWAFKDTVGSPYLLKGYKNEFYKYNIVGDSWTTLTPAPIGGNAKWDKGSWLASDGVHTIYAFKAKYMELYSYNTETDSWGAALAPMPAAGSAGSKKAKDGSSGTYVWPTPPPDSTTRALYAFKGGNTQEWWKYSIATNAWTEKETIPRGALKKKVKAGGSVTAVPRPGDMPGTPIEIPALKGNKTNELWIYGPIPPNGMVMGNAPNRDGVASEKRMVDEPFLTLVPNPLSGRFVTLRYSLPGSGLAMVRIYDVTGRTVLPAALITGRNGTAQLDLRSLSGGVYLLKVEATGFAAVRKLVVER